MWIKNIQYNLISTSIQYENEFIECTKLWMHWCVNKEESIK